MPTSESTAPRLHSPNQAGAWQHLWRILLTEPPRRIAEEKRDFVPPATTR